MRGGVKDNSPIGNVAFRLFLPHGVVSSTLWFYVPPVGLFLHARAKCSAAYWLCTRRRIFVIAQSFIQGLKSPLSLGAFVLKGVQVTFREGDKPSSAFYTVRGVKWF